jgi:hypothetical protein
VTDQPRNTSILKSGEKFTTIAVEAEKPQGGTGSAGASITTGGSTEKVAWSLSAWVKRKFQRAGTSAGVNAEIKF